MADPIHALYPLDYPEITPPTGRYDPVSTFVAYPSSQYLVMPDRWSEGYEVGYEDGHDDGYTEGYDVGYDVGLDACQPSQITSQSITETGNSLLITATANQPSYLVVLIESFGKFKTVYTHYSPETSWVLTLTKPTIKPYRVHLLALAPLKEEITLTI